MSDLTIKEIKGKVNNENPTKKNRLENTKDMEKNLLTTWQAYTNNNGS